MPIPAWPELRSRPATGLEPSPPTPSLRTSRRVSSTSGANSSYLNQVSSTGSWSRTLADPNVLQESDESLGQTHIGSPPVLNLPSPMFGRRRPPSPVPDSSLAANPSTEQVVPRGRQSGRQRNLETSWRFPQTYVFALTTPSVLYEPIFRFLLRVRYEFPSSGVSLEVESLGGHGLRGESRLILRCPPPSSGMVIAVRRMLYSMNFVVASTSVTSYVGSTVTLAQWRLRDPQQPSARRTSGSRRTSVRENGTQPWTSPPIQR